MELERPESYVLSVRLNADESRALTAAARWHGEKLSTYIKRRALSEARLALVRLNTTTDGEVS